VTDGKAAKSPSLLLQNAANLKAFIRVYAWSVILAHFNKCFGDGLNYLFLRLPEILDDINHALCTP
jgi:hypothetical protein